MTLNEGGREQVMQQVPIRMRSNIVLIGMPGSGKSTVGVILAKVTSRDFIDTDVILQTSQGRSLQEIINRDGYMALRHAEEDVLVNLDCKNHVIATGGSAAYSHAAMIHLKSKGLVVFLDVELSILKKRIRNFDTRGLAKRPDQTFDDLFQERRPLYDRYADITVQCNHINQEETCSKIVERVTEQQMARID